MTLGAATATGRVVFGKVVQYGYLNRLHMHQMSMVVSGAGCMILPFIKSFPGLVTYVVIVGIVDGCFVVLLPVLTATLAGVERAVVAWGFAIGASSVTFTLGPAIAGWLRDSCGNYNLAFHVAGVLIILAAVVQFLIPWAQKTAASTNVIIKAARESHAIAPDLEDQESQMDTESQGFADPYSISIRTSSLKPSPSASCATVVPAPARKRGPPSEANSQDPVIVTARASPYILIDMVSHLVHSDQTTCLTKDFSEEGIRAIQTLSREVGRAAAARAGRANRTRSHSTSEATTYSSSLHPTVAPQAMAQVRPRQSDLWRDGF